MRFPILTKTTLLAASFFAGAFLSQAEDYSKTKGTSFNDYADRTIEVANETNLTITTNFVGNGTFVKTGAGVLEIFGKSAGGDVYPVYGAHGGNNPSIRTSDEGSTIDTFDSDLQFPNWTGGELDVRSGVLSMSGFVNLWKDYGAQINSMVNGLPREGGMVGVDKITVWNDARLDVGQSRFLYNNAVGSKIRMAGDNVFVFLNNLRAGADNDQANSVLDVGFNNGGSKKAADDIFHVNIHIDAWDSGDPDGTLENGGSVGLIYGNADVYKTGAGKLTLLNESKDYSGKFFVAGGSVVLSASANDAVSVDVTGALEKAGYGDLEFGRTLWTAGSLTIAGTIDPQNDSGNGASTSSLSEASRLGADVRVRYERTERQDNNTVQVVFYKEAYFTDPAAGTLVVNNNEAIRNFQSQFANGVAARDANLSAASAIQNAADAADTNAPLVAGTGAGSYLAVKDDAVLAIYQEAGMGGIYKGTICGVNAAGDGAGVNVDGTLAKGGTIVKYGTGDLALILEGANYEKLALLDGGKVVVNITAIDLDPGSYDWTKDAGDATGNWVRDPGLYTSENVNFTLIENATETLKTRLNMKDVHFSTYELIDTVGGAIDVSDGRKPGTIELAVEQRFITGEVFVERGLTLVLTAQDLAGYTDADGNYRYYDVNGSGTYTDAEGNVHSNVAYYKNSEGERVYYYTNAAGSEVVIAGDDLERLSFVDSVAFSGGSVGEAKAVILAGKVGTETDLYQGSRTSTLAFGNTNQEVNNLTGDYWSKVDLGRSTLTVHTTLDSTDGDLALSGQTGNGDVLTYSRFSGAITGVGNFVKDGAKTLTLDGGSMLSYMGATVLEEGALAVTKSQSLWNSSLIWMNEGTSATFAGAQNLVSLVGGDATLSVLGGDLQLGMDASRRSVLNAGYQSADDAALGVIITNELGNSDRVLATYPSAVGGSSEALVKSYLKPILDFCDAGLTKKQAEALVAYFMREPLGSSENEALQELFAREVAQDSLTVADITRLYVKLLAQNANAEGVISGDLTEMVDRLSFNGTLTAENITKIGDDRVTIAGTVDAKSLKIVGGTFEMDVDAYGETSFADGITAAAGATLSINTGTDADQSYVFDKAFSGDGNFEKKGAGSLTLGADVNYFGQTLLSGGNLTMTLRARAASDVKAQGDITVSNADSVLTLDQREPSVDWAGTLVNAGHLVKTGTGALTLSGVTQLGGDLSVKSGALTLKDAVFEGNAKTVSVSVGSTLELNESTAATIDRCFVGGGTIEKSGAGELTFVNTGATAGDFTGTLSVKEGNLYLGTENLLSSGVVTVVEKSGALYLEKSQSFKNLAGSGKVFLSSDAAISLNLKLSNTNKVDYTNSGNVYATTINRNTSTDYSAFGTFSGDIGVYGSTAATAQFGVGGSGTFVFSGDLDERVALSVKDSATLITTALDRDIVLSGEDARVLFATDAEDARLDGKVKAENIGADGAHRLGKIGAGTLIIESSNAVSWIGADLQVLEGTLRLEGSDAFEFNSAVVVSGATLALECAYGVTPNLSEIEGSGTIVLLETDSSSSGTLELTETSMLSSQATDGGRYFNGILDAGSFKIAVTGEGVKLASIQTTGGFETTGQVKLAQNHDTTIGGSFNANVVVSGRGCLKIEDARATGTILVDNGSVQVNAEASKLNNTPTGGLRVKNDASVYFTVDADKSNRLSEVEVRLDAGAKAGTVALVKSGTAKSSLSFDGVTDGGQSMLNVSDALWAAATASQGTKLLLGVNQGELVLSGLNSLHSAIGFTTQKNVNRDTVGTFVINAGEADEALNRSISGNGDVAFRGPKTTTVSVDQAYTGATILEDGSTVRFEKVSLASSLFKVEAGATAKGGIKLVGGDFENDGTVMLDVNNGDSIDYAGNFANNGVIRLTGAAAATRGNELVLFKSLSGKTYSVEEMELLFGNGKLTNGSTALMLAQSEAGVISAYAVGTSFAETKGLHDGLAGSFTDVLDRMSGVAEGRESGIVFESELLADWGPIGVALNRVSAEALPEEVAKLSPIGYASMIAMARNSFENDWRAVAERTSHRRYDSASETRDNGVEFFARAQASIVENASNRDSANFDFNTYGAIAGFDVKPDDFSLYGVALGYDYGSAKLHGNGGKIRSDSIRATAFASALLGDGSFFLDGAAHLGLNNYDIDRSTVVGKAEGETDGWNAGLAATLGRGFILSKDKHSCLFVTPYVGLSYLFSKVDSFDESGDAGLDVDSFDAHSLRGRLGATLDWSFLLGEWDARVSLDVAYQHEFLDDEADIDAQFKQYRDTAFGVSGTIGSSDAFSFAPSVTVNLSERNSISLGYSLQYGTDEQVNHNLNAGFRRCF